MHAREALERHITKMNITTWMALQVERRAESCPKVIPGAGVKLREVARRVNLYPWGLGVTFPPLGGSEARCTQCAAPLGAESDSTLTGEPVCAKCATTIRAESDAPEGTGPHHGQGHPAIYD